MLQRERIPMDILLIDDEPLIGELLAKMLKSSGHTVTTVSDGVAALEVYETQKFALVITDMWMPKIDGLTLASRIKAQNPSQKIALLTGSGNAGAKDPNIDHILEKPIDASKLNEVLSSLSA
jgi:CheY-like chemotaxis protein